MVSQHNTDSTTKGVPPNMDIRGSTRGPERNWLRMLNDPFPNGTAIIRDTKSISLIHVAEINNTSLLFSPPPRPPPHSPPMRTNYTTRITCECVRFKIID